MTLLKINRLLPIYISIVLLKFEVDIQSQSKVWVRKPKNPIWPTGGHFWSDIAENRSASAYGHHQYAYEIWNWNSKANLTYAPETMPSTDRRTDRRTDGRTRWIQYTSPPTSLGGGIKTAIFIQESESNCHLRLGNNSNRIQWVRPPVKLRHGWTIASHCLCCAYLSMTKGGSRLTILC